MENYRHLNIAIAVARNPVIKIAYRSVVADIGKAGLKVAPLGIILNRSRKIGRWKIN